MLATSLSLSLSLSLPEKDGSDGSIGGSRYAKSDTKRRKKKTDLLNLCLLSSNNFFILFFLLICHLHMSITSFSLLRFNGGCQLVLILVIIWGLFIYIERKKITSTQSFCVSHDLYLCLS
jgi:hypothetical protein